MTDMMTYISHFNQKLLVVTHNSERSRRNTADDAKFIRKWLEHTVISLHYSYVVYLVMRVGLKFFRGA
jgi:hypothetical protein